MAIAQFGRFAIRQCVMRYRCCIGHRAPRSRQLRSDRAEYPCDRRVLVRNGAAHAIPADPREVGDRSNPGVEGAGPLQQDRGRTAAQGDDAAPPIRTVGIGRKKQLARAPRAGWIEIPRAAIVSETTLGLTPKRFTVNKRLTPVADRHSSGRGSGTPITAATQPKSRSRNTSQHAICLLPGVELQWLVRSVGRRLLEKEEIVGGQVSDPKHVVRRIEPI
jgi:hypothetical protein